MKGLGISLGPMMAFAAAAMDNFSLAQQQAVMNMGSLTNDQLMGRRGRSMIGYRGASKNTVAGDRRKARKRKAVLRARKHGHA